MPVRRWSSRSTSTATRYRSSSSAATAWPSPSTPHVTTSDSTTATTAPTPGAWAATARCTRWTASSSAGPDTRRRADARGPRRRRCRLHRLPVRGADAHRGRSEGARVQLPARRSRDPGADAEARDGPARAPPRGAHGSLDGADLSGRTTQRSTWCWQRPDTPTRQRPAWRSSASTTYRRRSCSMQGTAMVDGRLISTGGRVLNVVGLGATLTEAREDAYAAANLIQFRGKHVRSDIGIVT